MALEQVPILPRRLVFPCGLGLPNEMGVGRELGQSGDDAVIVAKLDTETTGLDPAVARVLQYAIVIYDTLQRKVIDVRTWLCWETDFPSVAEGEKIHGFNLELMRKYGRDPSNALVEITKFVTSYDCRAIVAHNGIYYDKNILRAELKRSAPLVEDPWLLTLPWLDTCHHIEYPGCPSKNLLTVAAHHKFLNPFPHDALSDCLTLAKIISESPRDMILEMATNAAQVYSLIFANVPPGFNKAQNERLKAKKFVWQELNGHFYEKSWIKIIKAEDFASFASGCDFQVNLIKDLPPEDCYVKLLKELTEETV